MVPPYEGPQLPLVERGEGSLVDDADTGTGVAV